MRRMYLDKISHFGLHVVSCFMYRIVFVELLGEFGGERFLYRSFSQFSVM